MRNVNLAYIISERTRHVYECLQVGPSAYLSGFVNLRYGIIFNLTFQLKDPSPPSLAGDRSITEYELNRTQLGQNTQNVYKMNVYKTAQTLLLLS